MNNNQNDPTQNTQDGPQAQGQTLGEEQLARPHALQPAMVDSDQQARQSQGQGSAGGQANQPSTVFGNLTLGGALFVVLWPLIAVAAYHYGVAKKADEVLAAGVRSRPGIVVGNVQREVESHVDAGLPLGTAINKANAQFQAYAKRGYVVLDSNAILAAPGSVDPRQAARAVTAEDQK